jgi:tetratricopeptide (TPR) repeat protein
MRIIRTIKDCISWYRHWGTLPVLSWIKGADFFRAGRFQQAIECYQTGIAKSPAHPARDCAQFDLAYCYYRLDNLDLAEKLLAELIQKRVELKEVYLLYSRIKSATGFVATSRNILELASQIFPRDPQIISCLAHACMYSDCGDDQLEQIRNNLLIVRQDLNLEEINYLHVETAIAHLEIRRGDLAKGERLLSRVLSTGQAPYEAVILRSERLLETSRVLPAREQLNRAMAACPKDPKPMILLARSYLRVGNDYNVDWAKQLADAACRVSYWKNAEAISVLARAFEEAGDLDSAEIFIERIKNLPSSLELGSSFYSSSLLQLRSQKTSNG